MQCECCKKLAETREIDGVNVCVNCVSRTTWERRSTLYGERRRDAPAQIVADQQFTQEQARAMHEALRGIESTYVFLDSLTAGIAPQHTNTLRALAAVRAALAPQPRSGLIADATAQDECRKVR